MVIIVTLLIAFILTSLQLLHCLSTISRIRDSTSGPLPDHLLSQLNWKSKIGLHDGIVFGNSFQISHQPLLYVEWLDQKVVQKMCSWKKKWSWKHNPSAFDYVDAKANSSRSKRDTYLGIWEDSNLSEQICKNVFFSKTNQGRLVMHNRADD